MHNIPLRFFFFFQNTLGFVNILHSGESQQITAKRKQHWPD